MLSPARRFGALAAAGLVAAAMPSSALAQTGGSPPTPPKKRPGSTKSGDVCRASHTPRLRCPNLTLAAPYDRYFERSRGHLLYHAGNSIVNRGAGPSEIYAYRHTAIGPMSVVQHIYGVDGRRYSFASPSAHVVFKPIPGQGGYWKFENAARFELWSVDSGGDPKKLVRTGPKLVYCLRDLAKRVFLPFSPPARHYPACNQDPERRSVTLGTSVGWADEYPAGYYEQYIDLTGLRGRFVFFQRVDPLNEIHESNEDDNVSPRIPLTLPPSSGSVQGSGSAY